MMKAEFTCAAAETMADGDNVDAKDVGERREKEGVLWMLEIKEDKAAE